MRHNKGLLNMRAIALLLLPLGLAACGGGGGGSSVVLPGPPEFDALVNESFRLANQLDTVAPTETLPSSDRATYTGISAIAESEFSDDGYIGSLQMTADFGADTLSGRATGFYYADYDDEGNATAPGQPVAGSLDYSATSLSDDGFSVAMSGTLEVDGTLRDVSGDHLSFFGGNNAGTVAGVGEVSISGVTDSGFSVFVAD